MSCLMAETGALIKDLCVLQEIETKRVMGGGGGLLKDAHVWARYVSLGRLK